MKTMTCPMWTKELVISTRISFHLFLDNVKFSLKLSRYMIEDLRLLRCRLVPSVIIGENLRIVGIETSSNHRHVFERPSVNFNC